ncbi:MAG: M23 family metallopeptidase [Firmicutes bacterium]|nr:M23 family metallopeptidase [Bacillota bacterium]
MTVYAHCKNIYVKEGQSINQWQKIGEVGATRKYHRTASAL